MHLTAWWRCACHVQRAVVIGLAVLAPGTAMAGAWPKPVGTTQIITSFTRTEADTKFGPDGRKQSRTPFTKTELQTYLEHGLAPNISLVGEAAMAHERTDTFGRHDARRNITRLKGGAYMQVAEYEETVVSLQSLVTVHTAREGDDAFGSRPGDLDYDFALLTGRSDTLLGLDIYVDTATTYRLRPGGRADEVRLDATLGLKPVEGWTVLMKSENYVAVGADAFAGTRPREHKLALSVLARMSPELSVELGGSKVIQGENVLRGTSFLLAFWYHL